MPVSPPQTHMLTDRRTEIWAHSHTGPAYQSSLDMRKKPYKETQTGAGKGTESNSHLSVDR
eukprot:34820-Eustigmatos_ZCMA.PRE.1